MTAPTTFTASPEPVASFGWSAAPVVSFITVTFGTGSVIERSLIALERSLSSIAAEVIVVDNPHPRLHHRTADRLALSTHGVQLIQPARNLGFGGGNELGILASRADLLCLINPDLITAPGWLEPLVDEVRRHPDCIVAPRLINADGSLQEAGQHLLRNGHTRPVLEQRGGPADYASAACWLLTRRLHERCGGFDARFHPAYFEDVDLALRVRRLGGQTIVADVDVVHEHGGSTDDVQTVPADAQQAVLRCLWADDLSRQPVG